MTGQGALDDAPVGASEQPTALRTQEVLGFALLLPLLKASYPFWLKIQGDVVREVFSHGNHERDRLDAPPASRGKHYLGSLGKTGAQRWT